MKDDAERLSMTGKDAADAVLHLDAIAAARSLHRPVVQGEDHATTLLQWNDARSGLHARPLFGEHEFAACKIPLRFREQERRLQRKHVLSVKILMQAVVVAFAILQEQRRRPDL